MAPNSRQRQGWLFVAAQAVLLVTLVLLPSADHWPRGAVVRTVSSLAIALGLAVAAVAALRLGRALTPTPVPNGHGELRTTGLYGHVRHPIYTGVLLVVIGIVIGSGNIITLALGGVTAVFFDRKAAWEEARLVEHFPDYPAYQRTTPRLIPRLKRTGD